MPRPYFRLDEGDSVEQIAKLLRVRHKAVYSQVERFQQQQDADLRARLAGAPRRGRLPTALGTIDPLISDLEVQQ